MTGTVLEFTVGTAADNRLGVGILVKLKRLPQELLDERFFWKDMYFPGENGATVHAELFEVRRYNRRSNTVALAYTFSKDVKLVLKKGMVFDW